MPTTNRPDEAALGSSRTNQPGVMPSVQSRPELAPSQRESFGIDAKEIARLWGCSLSTFRRRQARGVFSLRPVEDNPGEQKQTWDRESVYEFLRGRGFKIPRWRPAS